MSYDQKLPGKGASRGILQVLLERLLGFIEGVCTTAQVFRIFVRQLIWSKQCV